MADSSFIELHQNANDHMSEFTKDLERMIEHTEKMSLQLTWMAHDIVVMRTNPEPASSMQKLEDAYHRCRAAMETTDKRSEIANSAALADLENILQRLENLSNHMDLLAVHAQLRLCDLIVCVGHPDRLAFPETPQGESMCPATEVLETKKEDSGDLERQ